MCLKLKKASMQKMENFQYNLIWKYFIEKAFTMNNLSAGLLCSLRFGVKLSLAFCITELENWTLSITNDSSFRAGHKKLCSQLQKLSCLCHHLEREEKIAFFIREMTNYSDIPSHSLVLGQKNLLVIVIIVT